MRNKLIIAFIMISLIIIAIINFQYLFKCKTNSKKREEVIRIKQTQHFKSIHIESLYKNENLKLANCTIYKNGDTISINTLLTNLKHPILIYRFSKLSCTPCIQHAIKELKEAFKDRKEWFELICYDTDPRFPESFYTKIPYTLSNPNGFGLPIEEHSIPLFFILDKDMISKMVFIPDTSNPEFTKCYLSIVKSRFLLSKSPNFKNNKCFHKDCIH